MADAATWKKHVVAWRASGYLQADAKSVYDLLFKPAAERPPLDSGEPDLDERHEVT